MEKKSKSYFISYSIQRLRANYFKVLVQRVRPLPFYFGIDFIGDLRIIDLLEIMTGSFVQFRMILTNTRYNYWIRLVPPSKLSCIADTISHLKK